MIPAIYVWHVDAAEARNKCEAENFSSIRNESDLFPQNVASSATPSYPLGTGSTANVLPPIVAVIQMCCEIDIEFPATIAKRVTIIFDEPCEEVFESNIRTLARNISAGNIFKNLSELTIVSDFEFAPVVDWVSVQYYLNCVSALINCIRPLRSVKVDFGGRVLLMQIEPTAPLVRNVFPIARDMHKFSTRIKSLYADAWIWKMSLPPLPHLDRIQFISGRLDAILELEIHGSEHMKFIDINCPLALVHFNLNTLMPNLQHFSAHVSQIDDESGFYWLFQSRALEILKLMGHYRREIVHLEVAHIPTLENLQEIRVQNTIFEFPNAELNFSNLLVLERANARISVLFNFSNSPGERDHITRLVLTGQDCYSFASTALISAEFKVGNDADMASTMEIVNSSYPCRSLAMYFVNDTLRPSMHLSNDNIDSFKVRRLFSHEQVTVTANHRLHLLSAKNCSLKTVPEAEMLNLHLVVIPTFEPLRHIPLQNLTLSFLRIESLSVTDCEDEPWRSLHAAFSATGWPPRSFTDAFLTYLTEIVFFKERSGWGSLLSTPMTNIFTNVSSFVIFDLEGRATKVPVEDQVPGIMVVLTGLESRTYIGRSWYGSYKCLQLNPKGRVEQVNENIRMFLAK